MSQTPESGEDARDVTRPAEGVSESASPAPADESALAAAWRVTRQIVRSSLHSPLLKYLGYSLVIHVVIVAALSGAVLALPAGGEEEAASEADSDAATAAVDAGKPAAPADPARPSGNADDYYKKQGGGKAASPEDIPRAPSIGGGLD